MNWKRILKLAANRSASARGQPSTKLALALEAFLGEHRRCWRLYAEVLTVAKDGPFLSLASMGCDSILAAPKGAPQ
jgi:hypothetical protein